MSTHPSVVDRIGRPVMLGKLIAQAGEGCIYQLQSGSQRIAKIYLPNRTPDRNKVEKLEWMCQNACPSLFKVSAWPETLLYASTNRQVVGFLMPFCEGKELHELCTSSSRLQHFPEAGWKFQVQAAHNLAAAFDEVHRTGTIIADVNDRNFLVSKNALITLLDCDSFQTTINNKTHYHPLATSQFIPPELIGQNLEHLTRTTNHDGFGLAVIIFKLLFAGKHPYQGIDRRTKGDPTLDDRIREYRFALSPRAAQWEMQPPHFTPPLNSLPPHFTTLFCRAFERGSESGRRPKAHEWVTSLRGLLADTVRCSKEPGHEHWKGTACPWCPILKQNGPEYYYGAGGQVAGFVFDQKRLDEILARLAEIEAEFDPNPIDFLAGFTPKPTAFPFSAEQLVWLKSPGEFDDEMPAQPSSAIATFPEAMPAEPMRVECPPFPEPRPPRPASILIEDFPEPCPVRPVDDGPAEFPEPPPILPVTSPIDFPPKPRKPEPITPFDEERLRTTVPPQVRSRHNLLTGVIVFAMIACTVLVFVGLVTNFVWIVVGLVGLLSFTLALVSHRERQPIEEYVEACLAAWEERADRYREQRRQYQSERAEWALICETLLREDQTRQRRNFARWQHEVLDWKRREEQFRHFQLAALKQAENAWQIAVKEWRKRKATWDREQAEQWRDHPEMRTWLTADKNWQIRRDQFKERHRQRELERRGRWQAAVREWQERKSQYLYQAQEDMQYLMLQWKKAVAAWEERRRAYEHHVQKHSEIHAQLAEETHRRAQRVQETRTTFDKAIHDFEQHRAIARNDLRPHAEQVRKLAGQACSLPQEYRAAIKKLEEVSRQEAQENHLRCCSLDDAEISGIAEARKQTLMAAGIYTAADVQELRVRQVNGFGDKLTNALLEWRNQCLRQFTFNTRIGISPQRQQAVVIDFKSRQQTALARLEQNLKTIEQTVSTQRQKLRDWIAHVRRAAQAWKQAEADAKLAI